MYAVIIFLFQLIIGINCYSNDRCMRKESEPVANDDKTGNLFSTPVNSAGVLVLISLAFISLCCSSIVYGIFRAIKGIFDDLLCSRSSQDLDCNGDLTILVENSEAFLENIEHSKSLSAHGTLNYVERAKTETCKYEHKSEKESDRLEAPLLQDASILHDLESPPNTNHLRAHSNIREICNRNPSRHANCLFLTCTSWYILNVIFTVLLLISSLYYYPKIPEMNVCSDELAWNSIIDGMTSLKMEASFEILLSLSNTNYLNIQLDEVSGLFTHDGQQVGTLSLKNKPIVRSRSITDILITCTVVPEKWEAWGIIKEYYMETLILHLDLHIAITLPKIGIHLPSYKITDYVVNVNDPEDRHLCVCPQWKEVKTKPPIIIKDIMMNRVISNGRHPNSDERIYIENDDRVHDGDK